MGGTNPGLPQQRTVGAGRQEEINAATYCRRERELLAAVETMPCSNVPAVRFAELPALKQVSRNIAEFPPHCISAAPVWTFTLDAMRNI